MSRSATDISWQRDSVVTRLLTRKQNSSHSDYLRLWVLLHCRGIEAPEVTLPNPRSGWRTLITLPLAEWRHRSLPILIWLLWHLGSTNPYPTAVHMEPFFTSAFKALFWIFAATTKIFTRGRFTQPYVKACFLTSMHLLLVEACNLHFQIFSKIQFFPFYQSSMVKSKKCITSSSYKKFTCYVKYAKIFEMSQSDKNQFWPKIKLLILLHKYFLCPKLVYEFNIVGTLKNIGHYILMVLLNAEKMRCLVLRFQKTFLFRVVLIYMNIKLTPFVSRTEFLFPNSLFLFWRHILILSYFTEKEPQFSKSKISKSTRHVFAEHLLLVWQSLVPSVYCLWE